MTRQVSARGLIALTVRFSVMGLGLLLLRPGVLHAEARSWKYLSELSAEERHDIDLRTTAHDAYALESLFQPYQKRSVNFASTGTVQSHFGALDINGVQVEIIGDMQHRLADGTWEPIVDMNRFKVWVALDDIEVPVMSLPFLYQAYQLLGRADKVELLKYWLKLG